MLCSNHKIANMIDSINIKKYSIYFFRLGIFLLVSAPFISSLLFLVCIFYSISEKGFQIIKDRWNYLFLVASILMILVSTAHFLNYEYISFPLSKFREGKEIITIIDKESYSSFIGLANWIPLFFCFFGFQSYLKTFNDRRIIIKLFVAGSVPFLISGFGQLIFDWDGSLELLNGLIIWFQKSNGKFTGLFNNQNYAGCWLSIIWPFSISIFYEQTKNILKKSSSLIFIITIGIASFLTFSRNAWGGLLITIPLLFGSLSICWILPVVFLFLILIFLNLSNFLPENLTTIIEAALPAKFNIFEQIYKEFLPSSYPENADNRINIFIFGIKKILNNPLLGWGAASFPIYYGLENSIYKSHTHNLIIDTTFNYGLVISTIIFTNIFIICFLSFQKIILKSKKENTHNLFERAWWTSFFVLLCSQMFDVQYYDLRISISFWILLAGLKCIIDEKANKIPYTNRQIS